QPSRVKASAASIAVFGSLRAEGPNCRISFIQTMSLSQRWMSQSKSFCAGRGSWGFSADGGTIVAKRSKRLTISVVLPGRGQFLRWVGSDRHRRFVYQNVGGIGLQPLCPPIGAPVDTD